MVGFDYATAWNLLMSGNIFGAAMSSYTNVLGSWFYALVILLGMIMIYLKTNNFSTTMITGMFALLGSYSAMSLGTITNVFPAGTEFYIVIMFALGITVILYRLVH